MKVKIGIYGSSAGESEDAILKAKELGRALEKYKEKVIIITGACSGIPYAVAYAASKRGVEVWGFSPKFDIDGQKEFTPDDDLSIYRKLIYVPHDFVFAGDDLVCKKYRNVISTASADCGIVISGRWGTLNEFTNLIDFGKSIGVLTETGGVADELEVLSKKISKKGQGRIIFNSDPADLVDQIIKSLSI